MSKTHVVVVMGGMSGEHDVSLRSGSKVVENLDSARYEVTPVTIQRDGAWAFGSDGAGPMDRAIPRLCALRPDCVFLALHGPFGEDGRIQGMLDLLRIPYVGSGCIASGIAMDKVRSKALVSQAGVRVARQVVLGAEDWRAGREKLLQQVTETLGFPCVMKSPCQGSSLGMRIPKATDEFVVGMDELLGLDNTVLVEEYLSGVEVTCGVLDVEPGQRPRALPVTEIRPVTAAFFDYEAKYTPGATREITPAQIPEEQARHVQEVAVRVHEIIGCCGLSRSDMILVDGEPVWLEVNTIPGMTETSLFPQAAAAAGISFGELMGLLVEGAMRVGSRV